MAKDHEVTASGAHEQAIEALASLLERLKVDSAFVGRVAESVWLETSMDDGSVDVLAVVSPDRRQQIPMMAMAQNRCFEVDREAVEAARELDLIPMTFSVSSRRIPVHVLIASNALYSIMIRDSVETRLKDRRLKVVRPEDLALLLIVDESEESAEKVQQIVKGAGKSFDIEGFNKRLSSIGLGSRQIK